MSAKAKAESQLTVMTLSEENFRLMEENASLLGENSLMSLQYMRLLYCKDGSLSTLDFVLQGCISQYVRLQACIFQCVRYCIAGIHLSYMDLLIH